ncbi:MAG: hypothetical protein M5U28_06945 [Sandaracinaceae bacterium]|nr:hypothetical protein [Sandaracinaceae bacterium]
MLEGLLDGHHVFGSGHEWGYWQNEYCSFRMAMDLDYRWRDCLRDIVSPMGEAGPEVQAVLEETVALEERDIVYGDVLAYLVGTDPETEVAASVGIEFHPLPPSPGAILRWDAARVASWLRREMPALVRMDEDYARLLERLAAVEPAVPEDGRPWFDEVRDGIEVTGLRARHAWQVYGALVTLRDSQLRGDAGLRERAEQLLEDARATTEAAVAVIHRREEGYRYRPLSRSIVGGPDGHRGRELDHLPLPLPEPHPPRLLLHARRRARGRGLRGRRRSDRALGRAARARRSGGAARARSVARRGRGGLGRREPDRVRRERLHARVRRAGGLPARRGRPARGRGVRAARRDRRALDGAPHGLQRPHHGSRPASI